jgi:ABC-2 type transport system ATP-binding protein
LARTLSVILRHDCWSEAPQEVHLDRFLTAREVLAYHGRYFGMGKLEADPRADELLEVFDLSAKAGRSSSERAL